MRMPPEKRRKAPRGTTATDGIRSAEVSAPLEAPIDHSLASGAASIAAHHGQFGPGCWTRLNAIAPRCAATTPTGQVDLREEQGPRSG